LLAATAELIDVGLDKEAGEQWGRGLEETIVDVDLTS
jgi:hypothetical protein